MTQTLPLPVRRFALICVLLEVASLAGGLAGLGQGVRNIFVLLGGFWPNLLRQRTHKTRSTGALRPV